jgi:cytochrome b involved in lipid metabolism
MSRTQQWPRDLLYGFSIDHQVLFSMAAGHWLVSFFEDAMSSSFLAAGLEGNASQGLTHTKFLTQAYLFHHLISAIGYATLLGLQACTAVGVFGLIFELPVLFTNHREFIIHATPVPRWWRDKKVIRFWAVTNICFIFARYTPSGFYFYSIIFWQADLVKLGVPELILYHGMAIFFTILNYMLHVHYYTAWAREDRDTYAPKFASAYLKEREAAILKSRKSEEPQVKIDETVMPALRVSRNVFEQKDGLTDSEGEPNEVWIEVEGVIYNVTQFLPNHPGGEAVLRKYAAKDATAAFKKARHSVDAKKMMQKYLVGPMQEMPAEYRIFEHMDMQNMALWEAFTTVFMFGIALFLIGQTVYSRLEAPGAASLPAVMMPGLILGTVAGLSVIPIYVFCLGDCVGICIHRSGYTFGMCLVLLNIGFAAARQPLPDVLPSACPSGVELTGIAIYYAEDLLEAWSKGVQVSRGLIIAVTAVMLSWLFRGVWALHDAAPGHLLAPVFVTPALCWLLRRIQEGFDKQQMLAEVKSGFLLSGVYSALAILALTSMSPAASATLEKCLQQPWDTITGALMVANGLSFGYIVLLNSCYVCSPAWAARCAGGTFLWGVFFAGGFTSYRWLFLFGLIQHLGVLGTRNREALDKAREEKRFREIPMYVIGTQAIWDQTRLFLMTVVWKLVSENVKSLLNNIAPEEMSFFCCEIPIFDLGKGVDIGVAALYTPRLSTSELATEEAHAALAKAEAGGTDIVDGGRPGHFVFNVHHFDSSHGAGLNDLQRSMSATRECWEEFTESGVKGLVANCICLFPTIEGQTYAKEIRLSAWQTSADAENWQNQSEGYQRILTDYTGGRLKTFSNLGTNLEPLGQIRHQDRCTRCSRLVEADVAGNRAPGRCTYCRARTFGYPII